MVTISDSHGQLLALTVTIAATPEARAKGLMGVTHLGDSQGMVFSFPATTDTAFWMKDTLIPLDIVFWDSTGTIVDVQQMQPCTRDPCPLYESSRPYIASVETANGLLQRRHVVPGDRVSLRS